ncbi:MAG: lamin tail domain-containing protein, partial [Calditrichaceae bacterium]
MFKSLLTANLYCMALLFILIVFHSTINAQSARINEFMALNSLTIMDEDGDYSDWIELYNDSPAEVNLDNWSLTDDPDEPQKWLFPNVDLEPGGYLLVFASGKDRIMTDRELHTNFKLSGDGEYLGLCDASGKVITEFNPAYPSQKYDVSFGYFTGEYLATLSPTPGEENVLSAHSILQRPKLNHPHGMYNEPFDLEITTDLID